MLWVYVMAGGISTSGLRCLEDYIGKSVRVTLGEQNPNIKYPHCGRVGLIIGTGLSSLMRRWQIIGSAR